MLWQRQEQWNTKETKVARLSLRLKRDDNVVRSLWLELLTGDNPLKWPPPPVQPAHPLALQRLPSAPCCPFSAQLTNWLNCYYARKHNNRQQHHLISTKDLHRHSKLSGIWTSAQKRLVHFHGWDAARGSLRVPERLFMDALMGQGDDTVMVWCLPPWCMTVLKIV